MFVSFTVIDPIEDSPDARNTFWRRPELMKLRPTAFVRFGIETCERLGVPTT
ncbi:hypothetical protein DSO57_1016037 [Entomophthora muscae]|uniref:Uncharacterized protein n=1 Tax=Entomophthora muscae TaxID=34485 RepID=A0ACC2UEG2_9FUNG|nr:hypothetical protein DSO57_1016037 [Entomophthora muscae]